jgi:hypothetical protein
MMSKTKELKQIAQLEEELAKLRAIVEKENKVIEGLFEPEESENYYVLSSEGEILEYVNTFQSTTDNSLEIGNSFSSKEAAEIEKKKRIVTAKLKKLAGGHKYKVGESNYRLHYDRDIKMWVCWHNYCYQQPHTIYFETEEEVNAAIKELGDELNVLLEN